MDSLLETIDEIKTLIPDAKYMELMASLTKMHVANKKIVVSPSYVKRLVNMLIEALQHSTTEYYITHRNRHEGKNHRMVIQMLETGGSEEGGRWSDMELQNTLLSIKNYRHRCQRDYELPIHMYVMAQVAENRAEDEEYSQELMCVFDNFTIGNAPHMLSDTPLHDDGRTKSNMVNLYFSWEIDEDDDRGTSLPCITSYQADEIGKKILTEFISELMEYFL